MNVYDTLKERGFVYQATDEEGLRALLEHEKIVFYVGFDPTARSLHVGSLVPIMAMAHMRAAGHTPIALVGSGTGMVGDPSGKRQLRRMLSEEELAANAAGIRAQLGRFLDAVDGPAVRWRDNRDWLLGLGYVRFLREVGRYLSVNKMLARESARLRYDSPDGLSFLEFNYACLQAYDFLHLAREEGCLLQMGGQDQWGNICEGIDLIARPDMLDRKVFGATFPLLLGAGGEKFGKTADGNVWLDPELTPPFEYYQFWRNAADTDVEKHLLLFTMTPVEEARAMCRGDINKAKEHLAYQCTVLAHGEEKTRGVFSWVSYWRGSTDDPGKIPQAFDDVLPRCEITAGEFEKGIGIVDVLARSALCASKGEARRAVQGGGVYVNGARVQSPDEKIDASRFAGGRLVVWIGKKKIVRVVKGG